MTLRWISNVAVSAAAMCAASVSVDTGIFRCSRIAGLNSVRGTLKREAFRTPQDEHAQILPLFAIVPCGSALAARRKFPALSVVSTVFGQKRGNRIISLHSIW